MRRFAQLIASAFVILCFAWMYEVLARDSVSTDEIERAKISGKPIAEINDGDFVHPAFSPDGKFLAYAKVLVRNRVETTEVLIRNLVTRETFTLLNSANANKYAVYKVYVVSLRWPKQNRLEVELSDGDVDGTLLIFNPQTKKMIGKKFIEAGYDDLTPTQRKVRQQALAFFPELSADSLDEAAFGSSVVIALSDKGLLQERWDGIWLFDFQLKVKKRLVDFSEFVDSHLRGAITNVAGKAIVFLVANSHQSWLYEYRDERIRNLNTAPLPGVLNFWDLKYQSEHRLIFSLPHYASYQEGNNPLFVFNGTTLVQSTDFSTLYDVAIDSPGNRIAFCYWQKGRRHISVRELK